MKRILLLILAAAALCTACDSRTPSASTPPASAAVADPMTLPLPAIPDSVTEPARRAAIAALHFWDGLDFASDPRSGDTAFIEQNFANYAAVLSVVPEGEAQSAVDTLIARADASDTALDLVRYVADKYLYDPNSPMRNDALYILFLQNLSQNARLTPEQRYVAGERLSEALKNGPGSIASDFRFDTRSGSHSTLHGELAGGENLVMFYDSDCEHCSAIIARMQQVGISGRVRVIALDVGGNRELWTRKSSTLPREWIVGYVTDPIEEAETYVFRALPTFYVLDSAATVLLKDPAPALIL